MWDDSWIPMPSATFDLKLNLIKLTILILTIPTMITGLLFMRISKTKRGRIIGGVIILCVGITLGIERGFLLIPAVMATIGGYLGIQGAKEGEIKKRQYSKAFISGISIMGFTFALLSVFFLGLMMAAHENLFLMFFIPLWTISVILNIISTVVRSEETVLEKRAKTLTIVTWCLIAFGLASFLVTAI